MTTAMRTTEYTLEDIVKSVLAALQPDAQEQEEPENYVPEVTVKTFKGFDDYPDVLQAKHCRAILGLSEAKTYEVLNSAKCPTIHVGKRKLIRKESFIAFLEANEGQDLID